MRTSVLAPGDGFKVSSDLTALRIIENNPKNLVNKLADIGRIVEGENGFSFIKPKWHDLPDIVEYIYIYIPRIGYITEIQIGHEFAFETFNRDSAMRDNSSIRKKIADFWDWVSGFR